MWRSCPPNLSCDVAVVGYGPVGMVVSILLAQRGLSVIVVDRFRERYKLPRAGHFDSETLRTFQQMGIANEIELIARTNVGVGSWSRRIWKC